ncbi:MAG: uroporphyrinogen-III C-methyltransferase [Peptococcaceae bacterium]|nr:uroporphyrinogen-III C-methyltransferase [Peptococcaceae bacterium]
MKTGKVWLVGAGPSDAGLITVKGLNVLKNADVVVYDKLVGVEILNLIPETSKKIDVGKSSNNHLVPQEQINQILLNEALSGNRVVRLKGGDPFLFGRGGEELELIVRHQIPFEIVPGITSAISVPAYAGIPVTHRDYCSSLHIITGHTKSGEEPDINFDALVKLNGTMVFLMGVAALDTICRGLLHAGMSPDQPAAIIERGTTARQRKVISTLKNLVEDAARNEIKAPSVIVVGEVCTLAEDFSWAERRPLHGIRVVVTRPEKLGSILSEKIRNLGGESIEFPCIKTVPDFEGTLLSKAVKNIRQYNWVVFTSAAGVEAVFEKLYRVGKDIRELFGLKIAVIGSGTEELLKKRGIQVDYIPDTYNAQSLGAGLAALVKEDEKVLILRAKEGSQDLNHALEQAGVKYLDVPVYETIYNTEGCEFSGAVITGGQFDFALFTSASTVKGFINAMPHLDYTQINALCIGEQTAKEARGCGMQVTISPQATIDSMVETLIKLNH